MRNGIKLALFSSLIAVLLGFSQVSIAFATTWDYTNDFDNVLPPTTGKGPIPAWFYHYEFDSVHDGDYPLFTDALTFASQDCFMGVGNFHLACQTFVHPDSDPDGDVQGDVIIRFQSPQKGTYHVEGSFADGNFQGGTGVCVAITKHNPADTGVAFSDDNISLNFPFTTTCSAGSIAGVRIDGADGSVPDQISFNFDIDLICNESLNFRVNPFGFAGFDQTNLSIEITDVALMPDPNDDCLDPASGPGDRMPVGGEMFPVDTTALLLVGAQNTSSWLVPILVSGIGIGTLLLSQKRKLQNNSCPSCKIDTDDTFMLGEKFMGSCQNPKCRVSLFLVKKL